MLDLYKDILEATDRSPLWFDHHGVPRFVPFSPSIINVMDLREQVIFSTTDDGGNIFKVLVVSLEPNKIWSNTIIRKHSSLDGCFKRLKITEVSEYWMKDDNSFSHLPWYRNPFREGKYKADLGLMFNEKPANWEIPVSK